MPDIRNEDWGEYRRLILSQLEEIKNDLSAVRGQMQTFRQTDIAEIKVEIALLKLKSSLWGGALGLAGGALTAGVAVLTKML